MPRIGGTQSREYTAAVIDRDEGISIRLTSNIGSVVADFYGTREDEINLRSYAQSYCRNVLGVPFRQRDVYTDTAWAAERRAQSRGAVRAYMDYFQAAENARDSAVRATNDGDRNYFERMAREYDEQGESRAELLRSEYGILVNGEVITYPAELAEPEVGPVDPDSFRLDGVGVASTNDSDGWIVEAGH